MARYKHYSFDLWLTLIRSNPVFKQERSRIFHERYNSKGKTIEEIDFIFRKVDLMCNAINEKTGSNIHAEEMYLMVISLVNDYDTDFDHIDIAALYDEMEILFYQYSPQVYCAETMMVLDTLKQQGNTINILSNTGFVKGKTLRPLLEELQLARFVDFQLYSDEEGISKPNKAFFELMKQAAFAQRKELTLHDLVHIGDNPRADVGGANAAGISGILINSNGEKIINVLH